MDPLLAKQSEIYHRLNMSEHMYIKFDAYSFRVSTQCLVHWQTIFLCVILKQVKVKTTFISCEV